MAYFINPVEAERCVFLSCEGEMPPSELAAGRYEAHIRLLVLAACAAHGGPGRMNLAEWHDVEQQIKRRLENEQ